MRLALLHPTYWPEVRRGSERLAHDLGATLAARGHEVSLLTSHPAPGRVDVEDGVRVVRSRRPPAPPGAHLYEDHLETVPGLITQIARGRFDLAHALFPTDALAASIARGFGGPPFVFSFHGIINRRHLVRRRHRIELLTRATSTAGATSVLSAAAAEPFRRLALGEVEILPGGVICSNYAGTAERPPRPTIVCPASLGDPRKRGGFLLDAFSLLRERRPDAELLLAGGEDPFSGSPPKGGIGGLRTLAVSGSEELAAIYRRSWVTVLPSTDEAFGLVLLESLAAGTPVVAALSGACPEIIRSDAIGRLFQVDDVSDLARAMDEALELSLRPETAGHCRAIAAGHDWPRVAGLYEQTYARVVEEAAIRA